MIINLKKSKIGVILGGFSKEREVSLMSGENIYQALLELGYQAIRIDPAFDNILAADIDIAFIALHGKYGEDGTIQSFLELNNIPFTCSGSMTSSLTINKILTKEVLINNNIPTPNYQIVTKNQSNQINLEFPVIAKPVDEGSSVGIEIFENHEQFSQKIIKLMGDADYYLVEEYITGKELSVGIIQDSPKSEMAFPVLGLEPKNKFYDYESKYTNGYTNFVIPAAISDEDTKLCQDLAKKAHNLFNCKGVSRIDIILDPQKGPQILELNTIPGMTKLSDLPAQAQKAGISFNQLVEMMLKSTIF
jgi:D-alanine-D-alanine ligase